jgi:hypothetical protein
MDWEVAKQIRKSERKERQEKQARKTLIMLTIVERLVEKELANNKEQISLQLGHP